MFAMVEAHAAAAADLPSLSNHPIIEYFVGLLILLVGLGMWWKAERTKTQKGPSGGVEMHFDGPLVELLKEMKRVADAAEQAPEAARLIMSMRENIRQELERLDRENRQSLENVRKEIADSRHATMVTIQRDIVQRFERDLEGLEERVRAAELALAGLQGHRPQRER